MRLFVMFLLTILFSNTASAIDKRAPINILPYKKQSVRLIYAHSYSESDQYNASGKKLSVTEGDVYASKLIYRNTFAKKFELGIEIPYSYKKELKSTNAIGVNSETDIAGGLGDVALQLTYQISDIRKDTLGAIIGAEIAFPTGDSEESRGTGGYQMIYRGAISKKVDMLAAYLLGVYTDSFDGDADGMETNAGDDLYVGIGSKINIGKRLKLDIRYFYDFATSESVRSSGDPAVRYDGYDIEGGRIKAELQVTKHLSFETFYEHAKPKEHHFYPNNQEFTKKSKKRDRLAAGFTLMW